MSLAFLSLASFSRIRCQPRRRGTHGEQYANYREERLQRNGAPRRWGQLVAMPLYRSIRRASIPGKCKSPRQSLSQPTTRFALQEIGATGFELSQNMFDCRLPSSVALFDIEPRHAAFLNSCRQSKRQLLVSRRALRHETS